MVAAAKALLKASSSTCLVVDGSCHLGPQLGSWLRQLHVVSWFSNSLVPSVIVLEGRSRQKLYHLSDLVLEVT